jgi:hypothetical protein
MNKYHEKILNGFGLAEMVTLAGSLPIQGEGEIQ